MDSRLKLTKKQKSLVKRLFDTFTKLREENVGLILSYDEYDFEPYYCFINMADVEEWGENPKSEEGYDTHDEELVEYTPPADLNTFTLPYDRFPQTYEWVSVILPETEEAITFTKKKEKEKKLAPLNTKMEKLKKKLKKFKDAKDEAENNISRLIERHVAQEIIDEEMESVKTNKKQIADLKKEIKALRDEMNSIK